MNPQLELVSKQSQWTSIGLFLLAMAFYAVGVIFLSRASYYGLWACLVGGTMTMISSSTYMYKNKPLEVSRNERRRSNSSVNKNV